MLRERFLALLLIMQIAKTGPPVTKNFPLLRSAFVYSPQMLRWLEGFTHLMTSPYQFAYFDRARNVAHFDSNWPTLTLEKKVVRASLKPKLENCESEDHRLQ